MEDAEWHLEGLLNYEEANNEHNWHGLEFENRTYEVPVSNGQISSSDLNLAYESFLAEINSLLAEDENLRSDMVNIIIEENQMKDGTATVGMTYSFGSIIATPNYNPFGPDEYWVWGNLNPDEPFCGACGPNNPSTDLVQATDRLQYKFNHPTTLGQPGYFTDCNFYETLPYDWDENYSNPAYPERIHIMYSYDASYDPCLSPAELNFYPSWFDFIKAEMNPNNGKTFASVNVIASFNLGDADYCNIHVYKLYYGEFHPSGGGTE